LGIFGTLIVIGGVTVPTAGMPWHKATAFEAETCVWRITDFPRISNSPHTGEEESLSSPYYWAPFILVGSWR